MAAPAAANRNFSVILATLPGNSLFDFYPGLIYIETPGFSFKIAKNN
jgi:hypothetical protein